MTKFAVRLLDWFDKHGRKNLPWQKDISAYRVWVSEIMLQQTQVKTVIPYFNKFIERFPTLESLANASQDEILSQWTGLGYYARARNLHKAAKHVLNIHDGQFPKNFDDLIALPGIGRSTAGAILSITYGQHHAILDGNVRRVLARHRGIRGWPGKRKVAEIMWRIAEKNTPKKKVASYTQAIMDLGATLCKRNVPLCDFCPVNNDCVALKTNSINLYPSPKPKVKRPIKTTTMLLVSAKGKVYLERRPESGVWGGLWSFPELGEYQLNDWCAKIFGSTEAEVLSLDILHHSFSHFDLRIKPVLVRFKSQKNKLINSDTRTWYNFNDNPPGGFAAPVEKLINQLKKSENVSYC
ncbi:MAG: A/G-specific adenine glycosylase [Gammaproteobacteria bacterium]|nr:A/G-specific adenine glycosylase [Gammaproteobacteria bacterium]|tara:strand:+ start:7172 stop:8230 length:1059 start_codon:yes stop_codon:yes gene_type:complete